MEETSIDHMHEGLRPCIDLQILGVNSDGGVDFIVAGKDEKLNIQTDGLDSHVSPSESEVDIDDLGWATRPRPADVAQRQACTRAASIPPLSKGQQTTTLRATSTKMNMNIYCRPISK